MSIITVSIGFLSVLYMSFSGSVLLLLFCYSFLHFVHGTVAFKAAGVPEGSANTIPQCEVLAVIVVIVHLETLKYQILGIEVLPGGSYGALTLVPLEVALALGS